MRTTLSLLTLVILINSVAVGATPKAGKPAESGEPFSMVVMDPLALPLSCPCVAGYAQRKYEVLGDYLSKELGRPVVITFAESIKNALEKEKVEKVHLVIGKDSVVRAQGKRHKLDVSLLARLVGKDGKTTQTGLIVVRSADRAKTVADLADYRIVFGPADCDEKFAAARTLLTEAGVKVPAEKDAEISSACSDGACMIIDWGDKIHGAAVISSYAAPLLEGCGTIKKGELRVVGETKPVPFVAAFATNQLSKPEASKVREAILKAGKQPGMLLALETLIGFVPEDFKAVEAAKSKAGANKAAEKKDSTNGAPGAGPSSADKPDSKTTSMWPGWLGPDRNGRVGWLPHELPREPRIVWRRPLGRAGMGGLAATDRRVFVGDRDAANRADVFRCLDAATGDELWTVTYPTIGQFDYDNAPRATPLILKNRVYFFGAFGDLTCADVETGAVVWRTNVRLKFLALDKPQWGACSSPLAVDDMIVVNPGAPAAAIAALDAGTGEIRWQSPGEPPGHGSLILATLGGVRQIIGHTQTKLCGWEAKTGRQLWNITPSNPGDFNVPTPIIVEDKLLVCSENNGARLYAFSTDGKPIDEPTATNAKFNPQMSSPVHVGNRVFCVNGRLECFDVARGLNLLWRTKDHAFAEYGAVIGSDDRILVQGRGGELFLFDAIADEPKVLSRARLTSSDDDVGAELLTYPALLGNRLYSRCEHEIVCLELDN